MNECTHTSHDISLESLDSPPTWGARLKAVLVAVFNVLLAAQQQASERRQLASIDARMLRDMGINQTDLERELGKWFWER